LALRMELLSHIILLPLRISPRLSQLVFHGPIWLYHKTSDLSMASLMCYNAQARSCQYDLFAGPE